MFKYRETLIPRRGGPGGRGRWLPVPRRRRPGADFFKGKTVTYIVSTAPGGGYDLYGRLVAEYMQKYLPGSTFVVKNVPGAGHLIGANTIYASKPDGLTIGTFNTGLIYNQLINTEGVKFDLTKMSWIGKAASEPRVFVVGAQSPIKTFEDLRAQKEPVNFATSGIGSSNYVEINSADQHPEAAGQGADRLQRQRRPARHAARRNHRRHGLALLLRAVREERLWPLHRPDRRQGKRRPAAQGL